MSEQKRMLVMCDEGDTLLKGGGPPPPSMECSVTADEMAKLRKMMAGAQEFKTLMGAIAEVVGEEACTAMLGKTVAFVQVEDVKQRLKPLEDDDTPGLTLTHFDGAGVYRIDFTPSGESGYFLGTEMARRELVKLVTTPPRPLVEAVAAQSRRIAGLRLALETIAEGNADNKALTEFIQKVLKKDELS